MSYEEDTGPKSFDPIIKKITIACIVGLVAILSVGIVFDAGCRSYNRYQKRADAKNQVQIVRTHIKQAEQQAKVNRAQIAATKAEAEKRFQESVGIRRAQDEISRTLTKLYIQHEAIQAQENIGRSGQNNTVIYVPSGNQGVPLVNDIAGQQPAPLSDSPPK